MFCIEIKQIIENNPEKVFHNNYIEDDMKCKDYLISNLHFPSYINLIKRIFSRRTNVKPV